MACDALVEGVAATAGAGLTAVVDGRRVAAGTADLLASHAGVAGPAVEAAQRAIDAEGGWVGGWVYILCLLYKIKCMRRYLCICMCWCCNTRLLPVALQTSRAPPHLPQPTPREHPLLYALWCWAAGATACFVAVDGELAGWLRYFL